MKEYTVSIAGLPHTVLLDDDEAKRVGAKPVKPIETKAATAPANKARTVSNKSGDK